METVTLARHAMATRFEAVLHGENARALRAAGEEALNEVDRLEAQLSLYRPTSEIANVNQRAAHEAVKVSPPVFRLLQTARQLHDESGGAFDITVAPLVRCWGFMTGSGHLPDPGELAAAREKIGMRHVILNANDFTVEFDREGIMLDLGAIGKGYAMDRAAEILREGGVASALIHGGTSTVCAIGTPPDQVSWKLAIAAPDGISTPIVQLRDESLSVSAVWAKSFEANGKTFGHVLDPRLGEPVSNAVLSAVILPSATATDALSTALLVVGLEGQNAITALRSNMRTLVISGRDAKFVTKSSENFSGNH